MIADYTPSVSEMASLLPSRAAGKFTGGSGAPGFPDTTRVQSAIDDATGLVAPSLGGDDLDPRFFPGAKALIKLQTALLLEPSAWPEQARPEKSAFSEWAAQLNASRAELKEAIVRFRDEGEGGAGSSALPIASFPAPGLQRPCPEEW